MGCRAERRSYRELQCTTVPECDGNVKPKELVLGLGVLHQGRATSHSGLWVIILRRNIYKGSVLGLSLEKPEVHLVS